MTAVRLKQKLSAASNGFSAGYIGRSFRVKDPILKPHPLLLLRNNRGSHYLMRSRNSHLKKKKMMGGEMERESFPCWPASVQLPNAKLH